jgi:hypothetical protein
MATDIVIPQKERWTYEDYLHLIPPDSFGFEVMKTIFISLRQTILDLKF